jgi:hypothetical protein
MHFNWRSSHLLNSRSLSRPAIESNLDRNVCQQKKPACTLIVMVISFPAATTTSHGAESNAPQLDPDPFRCKFSMLKAAA